MRSKRVERVTLMRIVPRSESCRRKLRASRLTDTTVPSYSRVAAEATPPESAKAEMRMRRNVVFMAGMLPTAHPTAPQPRAKPRLSRSGGRAQVGVLVGELLGAAPGAAAADGPMVEVDDLVDERPAVLDREPRAAQPLRTTRRIGVAQAAVDRPRERAGIGAEVDHGEIIGAGARRHHRPPVGAEAPAFRPVGDGLSSTFVTRREIHSWLMDMDGVLVREEHLIPGADRFIAALRQRDLPFLLLTNNSIYTRRDLAARLRTSGLDVPEESIWTSALATAGFLADQRPGGSAFVIGESGLTTALHEQGYTLTENGPDYVVLGETRTYSFERITSAIRLILAGARFIATNPDPTGPSAAGPLPATGSVAALISRATGVEPYFVGKPNPLMMRSALNAIDAHSETTAMIGDRMDTDIVAGLEAGLETILVLTGVTAREEAERFPFRPSRTLESVAELADELG